MGRDKSKLIHRHESFTDSKLPLMPDAFQIGCHTTSFKRTHINEQLEWMGVPGPQSHLSTREYSYGFPLAVPYSRVIRFNILRAAAHSLVDLPLALSSPLVGLAELQYSYG